MRRVKGRSGAGRSRAGAPPPLARTNVRAVSPYLRGAQAARSSPTAQELHSCSVSTDTPTRTPDISDMHTRTRSPGTGGHLSTNEMTSSAATRTQAHLLVPPLSPPLSTPALIPHRMWWHGRSSEDPELLKDGGEEPQVLIQASGDDRQRWSPAWYWHNLLPLLCSTCELRPWLPRHTMMPSHVERVTVRLLATSPRVDVDRD
mmetsp:Transcript_35695/g.81081  ORF Transcript_35695/g.81081 Transcript_35695/m.81081 type:complete len:203 (-) Transcript_35695:305-913(-)